MILRFGQYECRGESLGIFLQKNYIKRYGPVLTVLIALGYNIDKFVCAGVRGGRVLLVFGGGENAQTKGDRKVLQDG